MIEFLNRLFGRQPSGATAKERLRLVLMSDHLSLAPEMIDAMKRDLVDVISRYVEVDRDRIDVHFEQQDKALAMLANIPITGVSRNGNGNGHAAAPEPPAAQAVAPEPPAATSSGPPEQEAVAVPAAPKPVMAKNGARPRRRRRKAS